MNQSRQSDTETLRSDIDQTRNKMDDTIEALGSRFQPRHLLDELLGLFRRHEGEAQDKVTQVRQSISHSSEAAMHTVIDTIKKKSPPSPRYWRWRGLDDLLEPPIQRQGL